MTHDLSVFQHIIAQSSDQSLVQGKATIKLRMSIVLSDESILHIRENTIIDTGQIDYAYHWQTVNSQIIHRWDNAHPVPFNTSPHHQHVGSEENIQPSDPMTLEKVLTFIANRIV